MKRIRVVAFDCDGVMFDTEAVNKSYYNQILVHMNKPELDSDQFAFVHMHTADEAVAYLFPDKLEAAEANTYRKQMPYLPFLEKMEIEPFLKPLLHRLRPEYPTAIATNRTNTIQTVLEAHDLTDLFDLVVSAWDVDRPKPYPDPLNKILDYFSIEPDQLLYIGDSELDQIAAEAAGAILVAYNNPSLRSDFHITSLREMEQILDLSGKASSCALSLSPMA
jgi:phosphoglycolate phosphatase